MKRLLLSVVVLLVGADLSGGDECAALAPAAPAAEQTRWVPRGPHRIRVRVRPGRGPALVFLHGFPDDLHLYDRLVPALRGRLVVRFDFLGWGGSDKPRRWAYTFANQLGDLDAVIGRLRLRRPVLVAHDASGPAAINWALDHPSGAGGLVLLNTFYGLTPTLTPPEAIAIFADLLELRRPLGPEPAWSFRRLVRELQRNVRLARELFRFQVGGFIRDPRVRRPLVAKLWRDFIRPPSTFPAFVALNRDLFGAVAANTARADELAAFPRPVRIVFGGRDPYLNPGVAESLRDQFGDADLHLIRDARHYVQVDEPGKVARLIRGFGR